MEKVKLQFLEIFPSISELTKNSQDLTISISSDTNTYSKDIQKIIEDQSFIEFQVKDKIIQFALYKSNSYVGSCEYNLNNETRWLSISNATSSPKQEGLLYNLTDCIRLRIRCSLNDRAQVQKINKKQVKPKKTKDMIELASNHNSTYFTRKERLNKQAASSLNNNNKQQKKDSSHHPVVTKLRNNKTCEGFDNNNTNTGLLLTDMAFDPFYKKNGSFHHLKNTKSSNINHNHYSLKPTSTCNINKKNNQLKSPSLTRKLNTHSVQTTIINNRNNSYENVSRYPQSYISHQSVTTKLDDKFKTFDDSIIDKNYENNIKNDEIIQIKDNTKFLEKMIYENSADDNSKETLDLDFNKELNEKDESRSLFNSIKEDFEIFYTQEYIKAIPDDTIKLELQLVIDKLCELQEAYHKELIIGLNGYEKYKEIFSLYSEKYLSFHKKCLNLKHQEERSHLTNTINTFISNHKLKHNTESININRAELLIWNQLPVYSSFVRAKCAIKDSSDSIFRRRIIGLFSVITKKRKESLNSVEKKLPDGTHDNKHSRTRSMEEPEISYTMPTNFETRNAIKAEVKCASTIMQSNANSHNKLISSSEAGYKKKESKFNKGDKHNRPSVKQYLNNKK